MANTNTNAIAQNAKFIALLTRPEGATAEELRVALNRAWAPTQYQLIPIAERLGYEYGWSKNEGKGERTRYHFTAKAGAKKPTKTSAKAPATAAKPARAAAFKMQRPTAAKKTAKKAA